MYNLELENTVIGRNLDASLNFHISQIFTSGQCYYICGRNGSGKTTLMRTICGYFSPLSGNILCNEKKDYSTAYFGHHNSLKQRMLVKDFLTYCQKIFPNTVDYAQFVDLFRLENFLSMPIYFLSCGQQKRVALAAFFLCQRDIYCLDEAASGLDVEFREIYYQYILDLVDNHQKIVIFSDHIDPKITKQNNIDLSKI